MTHRTHALIQTLVLFFVLLTAQALTDAPAEPAMREAPRTSLSDPAIASSKSPDKSPQIIILKLDDVVAHSASEVAPVSPRWQRITDFLKDANLKGSFRVIAYLKSKGCVFMTPSEYLRERTPERLQG